MNKYNNTRGYVLASGALLSSSASFRKESRNNQTRLSAKLLVASLLTLSFANHVGAATFDSNWMSNFSVLTFMDARTDDNQFTYSPGQQRWTIDPGADVFNQELYERPTGQSHNDHSGTPAFNNYFQPLDIVSGKFANDAINDHAYFSINLVG